MTDAQSAGWLALLEVHERLPDHWTLVGGQMVHLHCAERGAAPQRPTDDLDAVLDVRADGRILHRFTSALVALGFTPAGTSPAGHQHRWTRGGAQIDVLIPRHVGERAATRRGAHGGTTLGTPAAQQALDRSAAVEVAVAGVVGRVRRPSLLGALVAKAAEHTVVLDPARGRHRADFAVLTTLIAPSDRIEEAGPRDRRYLRGMLAALAEDRRTVLRVDGAPGGVKTLREILGA
ncbi:hypothetical protein [Cellulomonas pakistanensis]|nr:hypothetical protein [Cellulomonas pakistanensis]